MVKTASEIPDDSSVDEHVDINSEEAPKVTSKIVVPKEETLAPIKPMSKPVQQANRPLKPESLDQARLLAAATVAARSCKQACNIPASLQCCLCRNTCRKGMRLTCDNSPVCWGCAVKEITRGHVCWQCGEKNITSDSHLVRDQVLRTFVEQFITTGKLDPVHEQALRNGMMQPDDNFEIKTEAVSYDETTPVQTRRTPSHPRHAVGVQPDETCIARFSEDGFWYNGLVTEVYGDGSALVYFIDYGNSER